MHHEDRKETGRCTPACRLAGLSLRVQSILPRKGGFEGFEGSRFKPFVIFHDAFAFLASLSFETLPALAAVR